MLAFDESLGVACEPALLVASEALERKLSGFARVAVIPAWSADVLAARGAGGPHPQAVHQEHLG